MTKTEKIRNSIRAYILGDALGVPFEFKKEGTFKCSSFSSGGVHRQIEGTWSDDTSVLLCLIDAFSYPSQRLMDIHKRYENNLNLWYYKGKFNAGVELFDIGNQTSESIRMRGCPRTDRMGNGALFYSLPLAIYFLEESPEVIRERMDLFCGYTHNNIKCFNFASKLCCIFQKLLRDLPLENVEINDYDNKGDVINTYNLVIDNYLAQENKSTSLFEDLCEVINYGEDTDTNAALFGALMGMKKKVREEDWNRVRCHELIDKYIDIFINSLRL